MGSKLRRGLLVLCCLLSALVPSAPAQPPLSPLDLDRGANGLGLALRRVGVAGRVLVVTAHPDDENNGVLVRLSRGLGIRTALLTLTRGEGGQNAIGPELFDALGVLRTGELMAVHRFDGVEQYFGRAYEFGFSFSVEETFAKWGHDETLGDVVRVVRAFRPDVILTLPLTGGGGGQHHQATGRLALEAFRLAADPARYPEQLREGLRPWQARKIYTGGVGGGDSEHPAGAAVRVATGIYDPLLGQTWEQLGSRARAMHRCQGAGQLVAGPTPAAASYVLLDAEPRPTAPESDILDGVPTALTGLGLYAPVLGPALVSIQERAEAARAAFDPRSPEKALDPLARELEELRALSSGLAAQVSDAGPRAEVADRVAEEEADVVSALQLAQGLVVEAVAEDGLVTPGETFAASVSLWNESGRPMDAEEIALDAPQGWTVERRSGESGTVPPSGSRVVRFALTVSPEAKPSQPYWRKMKDRDRNQVIAPVDPTLPFAPPLVVARVRARLAGVEITLRVPLVRRYEGPFVGGEKRHVVQVVPELTLRLSPAIAPARLARPRQPLELRAFVRREAAGSADARLHLEAPPGWRVRPQAAPLHFAYRGEELAARFEVVPPARPEPGLLALRAVAEEAGRAFAETVQVVEYQHVERRQLLRPAETRVLALEVRTTPGTAVGYVMGAGDAVADAIRQLGVPLTLLSAEDLALGDLSRFSTVVTGIRAYETRPDLRAAQGRLMRWVEAGGHLVVQYNRAPFNTLTPHGLEDSARGPSPFAPYPAVVTSERISDETAPVRVLAPGHVLLTSPNRIGPKDWAGWVQERAIQLLSTRDPRYVELLAASDPFAFNPGEKRGLLVDAAAGKGTWTYVGLVLFRQVPAGVPGGWRLLANLVSRPRLARSVERR